jgi:hypothetical protein
MADDLQRSCRTALGEIFRQATAPVARPIRVETRRSTVECRGGKSAFSLPILVQSCVPALQHHGPLMHKYQHAQTLICAMLQRRIACFGLKLELANLSDQAAHELSSLSSHGTWQTLSGKHTFRWEVRQRDPSPGSPIR